MTFGELQSFVSYITDDLQFGYFTRPQVQMFLNNGAKQVQKLLVQSGANFYVKCVTTPLVVNQAEYVLPSDFSKVLRLEFYQGTPPNEDINILEPVTTMEDSLLNNKPDDPVAYWLKTDRLVLNCPPETAYTLRLYYVYQIGDMTADNDSPEVPERYHELIGYYAIRDCFVKDGRDASLAEKKIDEYKMQIKQDSQRRREDRAKMVSYTDYEYSEIW